MPTQKELGKDLDWISDRISNQIRLIACGILAIAFAIMIRESEEFRENVEGCEWLVWVAAIFAILTLIADFLQCWFAYLQTHKLLKKLEKANRTEGMFDYKSKLRKIRFLTFWAKQCLAGAAAIAMLCVLVMLAIKGGCGDSQ